MEGKLMVVIGSTANQTDVPSSWNFTVALDREQKWTFVSCST